MLFNIFKMMLLLFTAPEPQKEASQGVDLQCEIFSHEIVEKSENRYMKVRRYTRHLQFSG